MKAVCSECGVTGDFCGYHNLGSGKKSLCVACAEADITVWEITLADYEGGGIAYSSVGEAIDTMTAIISEIDDGEDDSDGYTIRRGKMSRLKFISLPEFTGF